MKAEEWNVKTLEMLMERIFIHVTMECTWHNKATFINKGKDRPKLCENSRLCTDDASI